MKIKKNIILTISLFVLIPLLYQNCGGFEAISQNNLTDISGGFGNEEEFDVISGEKTVSMLSSNRILDSMTLCLGLEKPSSKSISEYRNYELSFSEEGLINKITAPMMMNTAKLAASLCTDLVTKERSMPSENRIIFNNIDFNRSTDLVTEDALLESVNHLARNCWGRDAEEGELLDVVGSAVELFSGDSNETRKQAMFVCTAILSSLSGIEN